MARRGVLLGSTVGLQVLGATVPGALVAASELLTGDRGGRPGTDGGDSGSADR